MIGKKQRLKHTFFFLSKYRPSSHAVLMMYHSSHNITFHYCTLKWDQCPGHYYHGISDEMRVRCMFWTWSSGLWSGLVTGLEAQLIKFQLLKFLLVKISIRNANVLQKPAPESTWVSRQWWYGAVSVKIPLKTNVLSKLKQVESSLLFVEVNVKKKILFT